MESEEARGKFLTGGTFSWNWPLAAWYYCVYAVVDS